MCDSLKTLLIVGFLILILWNLGAGLYYLLVDKGTTNRTVNSLSKRIGLSIGLILFLCFQNTITQRKDTIIPWCQFHKFLIIFYRCNYIIQLNRHFTQRVQTRPVRRITFVCNL